MPEAKTKPTAVSVRDFLATVADPQRRRDCKALIPVMERLTGSPATMWGPSIVGFGRYEYRLASGKIGASCITGFSPRKADLTLYLLAGYEERGTKALLAKLGRHKLGKVCLYLKRLVDVDLLVLEQLLAESIAETRRLHHTPLVTRST